MGGSELSPPDRALVQAALEAWSNAYAPISRYRVGAALRASDGSVHRGTNVENIVLTLTSCAEKVAVWRAVADGHRSFDTIAVVTPSSPPEAPCGSCRQLLYHWNVRSVILANPEGEVRTGAVAELLPHPFQLRDPPETD